MKKHIKTISTICIIAAMTASTACLYGCSAGTEATTQETTETQAQTDEQKPDNADMGTMAKVTQIDGNTLTIVEASKPEGEPNGEKPSGEAPAAGPNGEKPSGEGPAAEPNGEKPSGEAPKGKAPDGEKPSGEHDGQKPNDAGEGAPQGEAPSNGEIGGAPQAPDGRGGGKGMELNFDGDEKAITVDESILYTENENHERVSAKLSDISVNSVVSVKYDTDGTTPKEIVIMQAPTTPTENGTQATTAA